MKTIYFKYRCIDCKHKWAGPHFLILYGCPKCGSNFIDCVTVIEEIEKVKKVKNT